MRFSGVVNPIIIPETGNNVVCYQLTQYVDAVATFVHSPLAAPRRTRDFLGKAGSWIFSNPDYHPETLNWENKKNFYDGYVSVDLAFEQYR